MSIPAMTITQVQSHFVSPLSQQDVERYQARLDIAQGVTWIDGAWYAIGDADAAPGGYELYQCKVEEGVVYLGKEDACGHIDDFEPAYFVLYAGCVVVAQS